MGDSQIRQQQGRVARVLLDSPLPQLDHLFDYLIPDEWAETALPGVRVKVPFRSAGRVATGYLIERTDQADFSGKLSPIESVVSPARVLTEEIWQLARSVADRSAGGASDVIRLAVPARQARVEKAHLARAAVAEAGDLPAEHLPGEHLPGEQSAVPPAERSSGPAHGDTLVTGYESGLVEGAIVAGQRIALGVIPLLHQLTDGPHAGLWIGHWALTLAEAAVQTLHLGHSAIIAVPDYRDQEQVHAALLSLIPEERIVRVDARQANADRYRGFLRLLGDDAVVVIGNRSAVYAPAPQLGLIAVWDDGSSLHAEPLAPYAHARDVALVRQEQRGCALIVAGHTRTTDTQRLVELGWFTQIAPERAYQPRVIPTGELDERSGPAGAARIPSLAWREATEALKLGPVLVQVARPGYAPLLACRTCREPARCTACAGPLGLTHPTAAPSCGWCGALAAGWRCRECSSTEYSLVSIGTTRTAEELGRAFPGVRVVVSDGDHPMQRVGANPALVIATRGAEPIAAGGYRAVILLDGPRMLARENLRVAEDCLRSWSNTAAFAAPRAPIILAGVGGAVAHALATWQQPAFARAELADRAELRFPPIVRLASVTGAEEQVNEAVDQLAAAGHTDILGPVTHPDGVRAIVRTDYGRAADVARILRASVIHNAKSRRPAGKGAYRPMNTLRVRFDDPDLL
ncbi:primosomal protein N' [Homoserinimonas sp. OAct 916]|uniref:primosomal protein N' family DNA-binding protein n=1 Tax=Homoserinimonas sp. OAct 916 TaxID=2211450 RepID=UPI000DBE3AFE|nr:primosomal protein N' [Homoserinimonas sp. OAct 916]